MTAQTARHVDPPIWITAREIADMLDQSVEGFRRNLPRLTDDEQFPLPSPHSLRPVRWRRQTIMDWIESQGAPQDAHDATATGGNVHLLRLARGGH